MAIYAFLLAAAALLAAVVLWYLDARQRSSHDQKTAPPELFVEPENIEEQDPVTEVSPSETIPEPSSEPEPAPAPIPEPERKRGSSGGGLVLPGALRRERRAWAEKNGFEFVRSDDYLNDEWSRGGAATGASARDLVSGQTYGYEMVLMDLGGVNVMALRRGASSDVVVDIRRGDFEQLDSSDDLIESLSVGGFRIFATDSGVAQRFVDERVSTALEVLPASVTAVWMESDWVLAQTDRASWSADWDAMLAPLALLADAAHVLPPKATSAQVLSVDGLDPTRHMPAPLTPGFGVLEGTRAGLDGEELNPLVQRPEEPLDLPTRIVPVSRGVVEPRAVGTDDVDAIGDGRTSHSDDRRGTRMPRDLSQGSSIFDDRKD